MRFLGEGTSGCLFTYIPCDNGSEPTDMKEDDTVSKVYTDPDIGDQEWTITRILDRIPRSKEYFVYPEHMCTTTMRRNNKSKCSKIKTLQRDVEELVQLQMPKADMTLSQYLHKRKTMTRKEVLVLLENVFRGVAALLQHNLIHQDIKPANIVVQERHQKALLIDFGLMVDSKLFYTDVNVMWSASYYVSPYEFRYAKSPQTYDVATDTADIQKYFIPDLLHRYNSVHAKQAEQFKDDKKLYDFNMRATRADRNLLKRYDIHTKYDVYSLGMILLGTLMYTVPEVDDDPKVAELFNTLLEGCLAFVPSVRFTIKDALQVFEQLHALDAAHNTHIPKPPDVKQRSPDKVVRPSAPTKPRSSAPPRMRPASSIRDVVVSARV